MSQQKQQADSIGRILKPLRNPFNARPKTYTVMIPQNQKSQPLNASTEKLKPLEAKSRTHDCIPSKRLTEIKRLCPLSETTFLSCSL
jgi:hypothetical protein